MGIKGDEEWKVSVHFGHKEHTYPTLLLLLLVRVQSNEV